MVERDVNILRHVEQYGFITIKQAQKMFFNNASYGYDLARKRLKILEQKGRIRSKLDHCTLGSEKIFFMSDKHSSPKKHTITIMDFYSEIVRITSCSSDGEILFFSREQKWLNGKRRSDAYCIFKIKGFLYEVFLEVEGSSTNKTTCREYIVDDMNKKYTDVISSKEPQAIVNEIFKSTKDIVTTRRIVIVDDMRHISDWYVEDEVVVQINSSIDNINDALI